MYWNFRGRRRTFISIKIKDWLSKYFRFLILTLIFLPLGSSFEFNLAYSYLFNRDNLPLIRVILKSENKGHIIYTSPKTIEEILKENNIVLRDNETTIPFKDTFVTQNGQVIEISPLILFKIIDEGKEKKVFSPYKDPFKILELAGIKLHPKDKVEFLSASSPTELDWILPTILVKRAVPVEIFVDGKIIETSTFKETVAEVLNENKISLGPKDKTTPSLKSILQKGMKIKVIRIKEVEKEETKEIPYQIQERISFDLPLGEKKIIKKGKVGSKIQTILLRYENGQVISKKILSEKIIQKSQPEIITRGAQKGAASWYYTSGFTCAHKTLPFGTKIKVTDLSNGKSVIVTVADRGPYVNGRIVDLSNKAFTQLAPLWKGIISNVSLTVLN